MTTPRKKTMRAKVQMVDEFNACYPIGTDVRYWPGLREGEGQLGKTAGKAFMLGGHTPVVGVDNAGNVALSHVEPETRGP